MPISAHPQRRAVCNCDTFHHSTPNYRHIGLIRNVSIIHLYDVKFVLIYENEFDVI